MPDPAPTPDATVHHTVTGLYSDCRRKLRADDRAALLTWQGVTCEACLAPSTRKRAESVMRADVQAWGVESLAWPFRTEVA